MKVLSLFDGISCGRLALERAGIPVEKYYASEIDKYAIQVAQKNYPDTIQVGDVNKLNYLELLDVDMVIGGSPCQDLSIAKQNRQGLRGERSGLFWKYVESLEVIRPKWFLLENVASMRNEDRDAITETLRKLYPETECIMINSALVSAQQRKRYYWTNWHVEQPQDKGILLKDILESGQVIRDGKSHAVISSVGCTTEREYFKKNQGELVAVNIDNYFRKYGTKGKIMSADTEKTQCLTASMGCGGGNNPLVAEPVVLQRGHGYNTGGIKKDKAPTLTSGAAWEQNDKVIEPVRIGELDGLGKGQANRIYSVRGKSVCLNANGGGGGAKTGLYKVDLPDGDYIIRKMTPKANFVQKKCTIFYTICTKSAQSLHKNAHRFDLLNRIFFCFENHDRWIYICGILRYRYT